MEAVQIELGITAWAARVVAGGQQVVLWEQCLGHLVEVKMDEGR